MRAWFGVMLLLTAASNAYGQTVQTWTVHLTHREERLRDERVRGVTELGAVRRVGRGAIGADVQWINESTRSSIGVGAEVYAPLWATGEGWLRVFTAPRAWSAPDLLVAAELTQHLADGWQISVSADDREYDRGRVNVVLAGAGWSGDRWFVRARGGAILTDNETMGTANALVRRTSTDGRRHVQFTASAGGDVFDFADPLTTTPLITVQSKSAAVQLSYPVAPNLGVTAGFGLTDYRHFGTRIHFEAGVTLFAGTHDPR